MVTLLFSCADLDVSNPNDPDTKRITGTAEDLTGLVQSATQTTYSNMNDFGLHMATSVMADAHSCSWGNAGMRDLSWQPRQEFNNATTYGNAYITEEQWDEAYAAINQVNAVLAAFAEGRGDALGADKDGIEAYARLLLGLNYGHLANTFDQAIITQPGVALSPDDFSFSPYADVLAYAMENFDQAIALANSSASEFSFDGWLNGVTLDKATFAAFANSYAARTMIGSPRTAAENAALPWAKIKGYAENGLTEELTVTNNADDWIAWGIAYISRPGWGRVDLRIINLMDSNYPAQWPGEEFDALPKADSVDVDMRLLTDFEYLPTNNFRVERGKYHFTNYRYSRNDPFPSSLEGAVTLFRQAERDIIIAEANAWLGDAASAISLINAGTRTTRGMLPELAADASTEDILAAIFHERDVELMDGGPFIQWHDMRRRDMLQTGSLLHFPIPGKELEVLQKANYTFGGEGAADGVNTSNGGWF